MQKLIRNYLIWIASVRVAHSESTHATMAKCLRCDRIRHSWMPAHNDMSPSMCPRLRDNGRGASPRAPVWDEGHSSQFKLFEDRGHRMKFCTCKASSNPNQANLSFGASDHKDPWTQALDWRQTQKQKSTQRSHFLMANQDVGKPRT